MAARLTRGLIPAVALLPCLVGALLAHVAWWHYEVWEFLYPVFRVSFAAAAVASVLAPVAALRQKGRWKIVWLIGGVLLLGVRCSFPFMPPWHVPGVSDYLDAYQEPWGVGGWILIHVLGCLSVGRLLQCRLRLLSILYGVFWALAIFSYLSHSDFGGDDLFFRWRT